MSQQSTIALDPSPASPGTERPFFLRVTLVSGTSLLSKLPEMVRRGTKLSMDESANHVHREPVFVPPVCQPTELHVRPQE